MQQMVVLAVVVVVVVVVMWGDTALSQNRFTSCLTSVSPRLS